MTMELKNNKKIIKKYERSYFTVQKSEWTMK
jgi:hypothetical protein